MRVECDSCRELVVASLAINGDTIRATCPSCNAVTTAEAARTVDSGPPCPKCGAKRKRPDATACASCGLAVEKMAAFESARDASVPDVLHVAWTRAIEAWEDPARHDELMRLVAANNCYAWAAGRYRTRPEDDAIAQRQLERIRRAAEATMLASATVREKAQPMPYRATTAVLAMMIIVIVAGLFYALVIRDDDAPAAKPTAAQPKLR